MPEIIFHELREEHFETVREIYNYYVFNSTATFHINKLTTDEMRGLLFFDNPKYKTFVIKLGDEICGYASLTQFKSREAYDLTAGLTIYLKPGQVGKGLGSRAAAFLEQFAREQGFHSLIASICAENERSIALFEKSGYFKCAHYKEVGCKFGRMLDVVNYEKILKRDQRKTKSC